MAKAEAVAITGVGMRTPVGNDAVQSAAAVRAGISRFAAWVAASIPQLTASCLPEGSLDAPWSEKVADMLPAPLHEALWQAGLFDLSDARAAKARVGAYLALPYGDRAGVDERAMRLFVVEAKKHCIAPAQADQVDLVPHEHASGLIALQQAERDLLAGKLSYAVVCAADSLMQRDHLLELSEARRLKLPSRPNGLIPGEGAAVLVLELESHARERGMTPLARLGNFAVDREPVPLGPDHPIRAEAASRVVSAVLEQSDAHGGIHRIIADLTGERWRSLEWALVETRCLDSLPRGWQLWHPADCLGDLGAASARCSPRCSMRAG
jgi:3-oxoacyl-[acyl-carrier-protein] synthase I